MGTTSQIIEVIRKKGILESIFYSFLLICGKVLSFLHVVFLNTRGYSIAFSVSLGGGNVFFQTKKFAIQIAKYTRLGRNTRINAGFSGKIVIEENVLLDDFCYLMAQSYIHIGRNTNIAAFCYIIDFNHNFINRKIPIAMQGYTSLPIHIEDDVWIGTHCVILPGVKIGKGSIIGAGSVVTKSIPPYSIAVGIPAKVVKKR